jgi:hypothetical protein
MSTLSAFLGNARAALQHRKDDLYETPEVAVEALLRVETLPQPVWECACGPGAIVRVLRRDGYQVVATDLVNYGCPDSQFGVHFLFERHAPAGVTCIVTNPPYKLAAQFVMHPLQLAPRVVMLLRLAFLESEQRGAIHDQNNLARVYVLRNRLPMMHRDGWTGQRASSATAFACFCCDREHSGRTEISRISWERRR